MTHPKPVNGGSGIKCALNPASASRTGGQEGRRRAAHLGVRQLAEVGCDVEEDAFLGTRQRHSSEEQDDQHDVGIGGREVDHLGGKWGRGHTPFITLMLPFSSPHLHLYLWPWAWLQLIFLQEDFLDS